jgi:hypothetical protein
MRTLRIKSIKKIKSDSKRYDIEVKKNHNFLANGVVVHNSLGIMFHYANEWHLATRGSFVSEQAIKGKEILDRNNLYVDLLSKDFTYLFEIIY